ncbi:vWA domain-containing protein [Arthrobacter celericrescens]|uniref:vWA domain-containing protein n=1 Tax=Arthrobacter celericrescens TaxID=2320851 RepID=UPI000EA0AA7B|nr:VWA domain-containing protein [Arthrobacter celericrescens]
MELSFWWVLPLAAAALALAVNRAARRARGRDVRPVAHSERLTALPEYRRALRRHRRWLATAVVAGFLLLAATALAAARPAERSTTRPELRNRDIILCLDVSGSMAGTDAAITGVFEQLAKEFDGERIGMVMFDSRAVQLFPLSDDYDYIAGELAAARKAFDDGGDAFFSGTWGGNGSSLVGDGLASCLRSFPGDGNAQDAHRSRSVILATDNYVSGTPVFTLEQAAQLATPRGIRIHALNPGDLDYGDDKDQPGARLRAVAESSGGSYFAPDNPDAVPGIVQKVRESEATEHQGAPQLVVADRPELPLLAALLSGAVLLFAGWRLER